ncbi:unnamed protein product, partial [Meganyctiphanes norvegica]
LAYTDVDAKYDVNIPNNGLGSGGAFLFDVSNLKESEYMRFESKNKIVTIQISYFCDKQKSTLQLFIDFTPLPDSLCGEDNSLGRAGEWTVTEMIYKCENWAICRELKVVANSLNAGGAIGVEYIV